MHALILLVVLFAQVDPKEERRYPPSFEAGIETKYFTEIARIAGLTGANVRLLEGSEPVPSSPLVIHRIEVTGNGDHGDIGFLLDSMRRRDYRAIELESLETDAEGNFSAVFLLPIIDTFSKNPLTAASVERFRASKLGNAATLLESVPSNTAIHLTEVRSGKDLSLRGVVIGAAAREQIRNWLEEKGFGASTMTIAEDGGCRPFSVAVVRGTVGQRMSVLSRKEKVLNAADAALCKPKLARHLGTLTVRGSGAIDLQLKRADVSALAFVLHDLTGENLIVDSDVAGTLDVDAQGATADAIFGAMPSVGLRVSAPPVRRISLAAGSPAPAVEGTYTGEAVTFELQNVGLASVLCVFADMTKLNIVIPSTSKQRSAIFIRDLPWDRALVEIIAAAGLGHSLEKTTLYVGDSKVGGRKTCEAAASTKSHFLSGFIPLETLSAGDLDLAGRARIGRKFRAYAYTPTRLVQKLEGGEKLFDSKVVSIDWEGVTFREGQRLPFQILFDSVSVPALIGVWECVSGPCIDPQIEFGVYEKVLRFNSWLHNRPSAAGTWRVKEKTVTVNCCSGRTRNFEIVSVTPQALVLREDADEQPARYRRIED